MRDRRSSAPPGGAAGAASPTSPEARDGRADPLDRWSRRVVDALAAALGARALYPFDGPPHWPFQRWARRAEAVHVSPLGLLIHPDYGFGTVIAARSASPSRSPFPTCRAARAPAKPVRRGPASGLPGRRLRRATLRRRGLRGAFRRRGRPRLHGRRLPRPARLSGRRRPCARAARGGFHMRAFLERARGPRLRSRLRSKLFQRGAGTNAARPASTLLADWTSRIAAAAAFAWQRPLGRQRRRSASQRSNGSGFRPNGSRAR